MTKTVDSVALHRLVDFDFSIQKTAASSTVTLARGESKALAYQLVVTRTPEVSNRLAISGQFCVTNNSGTAFFTARAVDTVTGGGGVVAQNVRQITSAEGFGPSPQCFSYSFNFAAVSGVSSYTNTVEVQSAIGNASDSVGFGVPEPTVETIHKVARVTDVITACPAGLTCVGGGTFLTRDVDSETFPVTITVTNNSFCGSGVVSNTATVGSLNTGEGGGSVLVYGTSSANVTIVAAPCGGTTPTPPPPTPSSSSGASLSADVAVTKTGSPNPVSVGANVTWTETVTNNGPDTATNVQLTDTLPSGSTFVSASASQGSCSGTAVVVCSLGSLAKGATATVTIVATANTAGTETNSATVKASEFDTNTANNSATASVTVNAFTPPTTPTKHKRVVHGATGHVKPQVTG